jgi:DnaB-like helicase N terminal domain/AAA domain
MLVSAAEAAVLGSLLMEPRAWPKVADVVCAADFTRPDHRLIFEAIALLAVDSLPHDPVTVSEHLARTGQLDHAGGLAYLSTLLRETPTAENALAYAEVVRDRAVCQRLAEISADGARGPELLERLEPQLARLKAGGASATQVSPTIELRHIADLIADRREVEWLGGLDDVLERRVLALLVGPRNSLKSFIALHWAMLAALSGEPVCILSAEGGGLGRRMEAWLHHHAPRADVCSLRVLGLERRLNLNSPDALAALRARIDTWEAKPALTLIDTFSKYSPGVDENDNSAVAQYLAGLHDMFVDGYGSTLLAVAHAGHGDAKRPRGASVLMANPDAEYIVERAGGDGLAVTITRERFKDSPALPPLAYSAHVVNLGRLDRRGHPVTSVALQPDAQPAAHSPRMAVLRGKHQRQLLAAMRAQNGSGPEVWTLADMREIGRNAGMSKSTAWSAAEVIATSPFMIASVGGWKLADA